jgi:hypothetical protein
MHERNGETFVFVEPAIDACLRDQHAAGHGSEADHQAVDEINLQAGVHNG